MESSRDPLGRRRELATDGGGLESGQLPYMAASKLHDPPVSHISFDSNFLIREISQKSRVFCRDSVGGRAKNERIFEKFRFYMVRIFF